MNTAKLDALNKAIRAAVSLRNKEIGTPMKRLCYYQNEDASRASAVYRDSAYDEYRVLFFKDGVYQTDADYHGETREDAERCAQFWIDAPELKSIAIEAGALPEAEPAQEAPAPVKAIDRLPTLTRNLLAGWLQIDTSTPQFA